MVDDNPGQVVLTWGDGVVDVKDVSGGAATFSRAFSVPGSQAWSAVAVDKMAARSNTVTRHDMVSHLSPLIAAVERFAVHDGSEDVSIASLRKAVRPIVRLDARR